MSSRTPSVDVVVGDMFESRAQTLVNTVNCVGVMGKGVAAAFRKRFPAMYVDYVARCDRHEVRLGRPYLYREPEPPNVLNFPTKQHWRAVSRLSDIVEGLNYLQEHYEAWGITSLAVPPLGCGNGGLEWRVVGPTLYQHLAQLPIPVELYAPFGTPHEEMQPRYLQRSLMSRDSSDEADRSHRVLPGWIAIVAALNELERDPHHWPIGKTSFQKLAYFLTVVGVPTELGFARSTYGPYSPDLAKVTSRLVNNDLIEQSNLGKMIRIKVGKTFDAGRRAYADQLEQWESQIAQVANLMARMDTRQAEVAATAHFVAAEIESATGETPSDEDVLIEVMEWKQRKRPPLHQEEVLGAIHSLAMLGWLKVTLSDAALVDEAALVGL
jgi:uncharacterized protein YwgA/O-acetyl-ADP-ribose deacetylase (regulator of RNase III)